MFEQSAARPTLSRTQLTAYVPPRSIASALLRLTDDASPQGFGGPQGMIVSEHYMEAIADKLNLDIDHVRQVCLPFFVSALVSDLRRCRSISIPKARRRLITRRSSTGPSSLLPRARIISVFCPSRSRHVPRLLSDCRKESEYDRRRADVDKFNKEHKWRKRGIALLPTKFGVSLCSGVSPYKRLLMSLFIL
jgi:xanthine dehydrogenase/oxidase